VALAHDESVASHLHQRRVRAGGDGAEDGNFHVDALELAAGQGREARVLEGRREGHPRDGQVQGLVADEVADAAAQIPVQSQGDEGPVVLAQGVRGRFGRLPGRVAGEARRDALAHQTLEELFFRVAQFKAERVHGVSFDRASIMLGRGLPHAALAALAFTARREYQRTKQTESKLGPRICSHWPFIPWIFPPMPAHDCA